MTVTIYDQLATKRLSNQLWEVINDFRVKVGDNLVIVPKGFITNGASVPNVFWWLCAPVAGPFGEAAVVHDWLYNIMSTWDDRKRADQILYEIGRYRGANLFRGQAVYRAVRLFGRLHWKKEL